MSKVLFYFDESGYQGYIKNIPPDNNLIGVIGGLTVPSDKKDFIEKKLNSIFGGLNLSGATKLHSRQIFNGGKNQGIRSDFYNFLSNQDDCHIIYEAVYCYELHLHHKFVESLHKNVEEARTDKHVKITSHQEKESVYHYLMGGIICKIVVFCESRNYQELEMISDPVDEPIEDKSIKLFTKMTRNTNETTVKGYNTQTKEKLEGKITTSVINYDLTSRYQPKFTNERSVLTFAADIITNSLHYYLSSKIGIESLPPLNGPSSIDKFELRSKVQLADDWYIWDFRGEIKKLSK